MIARIRALNVTDGTVFMQRIEEVYKTTILESHKLYRELIDSGAIREMKDTDVRDDKFEGNILWRNIRKFRVPKDIMAEETKRVKDELEQGKFPKTVEDSNFYKSIIRRLNKPEPKSNVGVK